MVFQKVFCSFWLNSFYVVVSLGKRIILCAQPSTVSTLANKVTICSLFAPQAKTHAIKNQEDMVENSWKLLVDRKADTLKGYSFINLNAKYFQKPFIEIVAKIKENGCNYLVGIPTSREAKIVTTSLLKTKVRAISLAASAPDLEKQKPNFFSASPKMESYVEEIIRYISQQNDRFLLIYDSSETYSNLLSAQLLARENKINRVDISVPHDQYARQLNSILKEKSCCNLVLMTYPKPTLDFLLKNGSLLSHFKNRILLGSPSWLFERSLFKKYKKEFMTFEKILVPTLLRLQTNSWLAFEEKYVQKFGISPSPIDGIAYDILQKIAGNCGKENFLQVISCPIPSSEMVIDNAAKYSSESVFPVQKIEMAPLFEDTK